MKLSAICSDFFPDDGCPFSDAEDCCTRPNDAACPALTAYQATALERCADKGASCVHLERFDPSPSGISLPRGHMTTCAIDADPTRCPLCEYEDDQPSISVSE